MLVNLILNVALLGLLSAPVLASNTVQMPKQTEVLVIDGKAADDTAARVDKYHVRLPDGEHQIVFRIATLLTGSSGKTMHTSDPYAITFSLRGNQSHQFNMTTLNTVDDAKQLTNALTKNLTFADSNMNSIPYHWSVLKKRGLQLGRNIVEETKQFNLSSSSAALPSLLSSKIAVAKPLAKQEHNDTTSAKMVEQKLEYWFNQADKKTRAQFLQWANKL